MKDEVYAQLLFALILILLLFSSCCTAQQFTSNSYTLFWGTEKERVQDTTYFKLTEAGFYVNGESVLVEEIEEDGGWDDPHAVRTIYTEFSMYRMYSLNGDIYLVWFYPAVGRPILYE